MTDDQFVSITLERWRWERLLRSLDRYATAVNAIRALGDDGASVDDLDRFTADVRRLVEQATRDEPAPAQSVGESRTLFDAQVSTMPARRNPPWSAEENSAVIDAYFWMLDEQNAFRDLNKRKTYLALKGGVLHLRSLKSIQFKMCNISAVLQQHGIEWVEGLAPLANLQHDLAVAVEQALAERGLIDRAETDR